jgi:hypothetical protein
MVHFFCACLISFTISLPGKLAAMSMGVASPCIAVGEMDKLTTAGVGGKIYPPPAPPQQNSVPSSSSFRGLAPPHPYLKSSSPISGNIQAHQTMLSSGLIYQPQQQQQRIMEEDESFRDMTFSQLMRRHAPSALTLQ